MTIKIISSYISTQNRVVCLAQGQSYIFPYKLTTEQAEELNTAVNAAGQIETER